MRCEPAATIIEKLGGVSQTARLAGVSHSTVSRWKLSKEEGGTGGAIPGHNIARLVANARREKGIVLDWADFEPPEMKRAREKAAKGQEPRKEAAE